MRTHIQNSWIEYHRSVLSSMQTSRGAKRQEPPGDPRPGNRNRENASMAAERGAPMFGTKVAVLVLEDLAVWQKLNVTAFLATGIAGAAPDAMGEPYRDAGGQSYAALLGQPIMILAADLETLRRTRRQAIERGLACAVYVRSMFSTGHDAANRAAFLAEPPEAPDLVGVAVRGDRRDVDRAVKGARLHP
jgi:hypothetical protein